MNRNIRQTLLAPAALLLAVTLGLAGCTNDDDFGRLPSNSIPLQVGDVTVAGMKPGTRAAGGNAGTRAAISENAEGYTGIRKSTFVNGDELALVLSNDGGTTNISVTATLIGGAWVLSEKAYVIPGVTTIKATHTGTEVTTGIKPDALEADTYILDGQKVTFAMKHANAMIDITLPAGTLPTGVTVTSITLAAHNGIADETITTVMEEDTDVEHYRAIALPGTTATPGNVKSITAVIGGQSYVATLATPLTVEANKKYPVSLTFKDSKLTATVGTASTNWGAGATINIVPAGYTRVIRTPEDLAQFAKDVNDDAAGTGARAAVVLQTADLDMSLLKPAAEAGINPLTGTAYTYTATADSWEPIGKSSGTSFTGKYNGDGRTISNLKITTGELSGLFGNLSGAAITGIHLRGFTASGTKGGGALAASVESGCVITLCSATGTLTTNGSYHHSVGGFIGKIDASTVTRCSADMDVTMNSTDGYNELGGFIGKGIGSTVAGCSATADVAWNSTHEDLEKICGFIGWLSKSKVFGCYGNGTMQDTNHAAFAMFNDESSVNAVTSCYSTVEGEYFINVQVAITDCAFAYTDVPAPPIPAITGVTSNVTPATAYAVLTASTATTSLADVKTLHWNTADGYTLTPMTRTWDSDAIWKDNGTAAPTLDLTYEGWDGLYEGTTPNLLEITGQTAYYVAPVNANTGIEWNIYINAICPKGWHVPTKDELVAMTGLPADGITHVDNYEAIKAVFPVNINNYWSSTEDESDASYAWILKVTNSNVGIIWFDKRSSIPVRCVRKK